MKAKLEKLDSSKFQKLENEDLKRVVGGYVSTSDPCATSGKYTTYVMLPSGDYVTYTDRGGDCIMA